MVMFLFERKVLLLWEKHREENNNRGKKQPNNQTNRQDCKTSLCLYKTLQYISKDAKDY